MAVNPAPIVLVPGFWLGAWAWDGVAAHLRGVGHAVTAITLPGLDSASADRSRVTISDHVTAICDVVKAAGHPVVLAVHSGAGVPGYGVTDLVPQHIAAMVYVDSGPATGALDPNFSAIELPLPTWQQLEEEGNSLDGLTEQQLEIFRRRAVPEPGGALREAPKLSNHARLDVPTVVICTSSSSDEIKGAAAEGYPWVGGLTELREVRYIDLPTGHWPMWSRTEDLAQILGRIAEDHSPGNSRQP